VQKIGRNKTFFWKVLGFFSGNNDGKQNIKSIVKHTIQPQNDWEGYKTKE